ncbi:uncharacterized protein LOC125767197 isoform X1 [Anopheles funestus]|uniref:uncharacterized protein LOC125767197 n=1 Tax=Anopheles funestus TaxID=62324 RepID=UPI0020C6EF74|nr:uncharacterized protein LOC125767197 [Anopheles funestus]
MSGKANRFGNRKQTYRSTPIQFDPDTRTHSAEPLPEHVSSDKARHSRHGDSYQRELGLVIMLRAFRMYQQDRDFNFEVTMEDPAGGDFDDIMFRYESPRLSTGTVSVQAKHKRLPTSEKSKLTKEMLLPSRNSDKNPFSFTRYFLSFLQVDRKLKTNTHNTYVLCTNALLDKNLEKSLMVKRDRVDDWLQFSNDIEATCYQINRNKVDKELKEKLINSCALKLAEQVSNGTVIAFEDSLYRAFATMINDCVQSSVTENSAVASGIFRFNEDFLNADPSSDLGMFREGFKKAYTKFIKNDKSHDMKEIVLKIDMKSFTSATSEGESLDRNLQKFYKSFVLVCNSLKEDELRGKVTDLLPKWCNSPVVMDSLHELLCNAMSSETPKPIKLSYIKEMFITKAANINFTKFERDSNDYLEGLRLKYPYIEIEPGRLNGSAFAVFLKDVATGGVYEFKSRIDLKVSSLIVAQTLSLFEWKTLFVDSSKLEEKENLMEILQDLFSYNRDVNHPTVKLITFVGKPNHGSIDAIEKLSKQYNQKFIVIEKMLEKQNEDNHCERFYVNDLMPEASRQLFKNNVQKKIFGTVVSLNRIVDKSDDLCFVLALLESFDQSSEMNDNRNNCSYEKIKHCYIHRHYEPDDDNERDKSVTQYMHHNLNDLPHFKHEDVSFTEMVKFIDYTNSTLPDVQRVFDMNEEDPVPPGFQVGDREKVFVFLNDAGHGKTSYFTWLAWRLSQQDGALYVVKFNGVEYSTDFERLENGDLQNMNDTGIVRFLYRLVHLALFVPSVNRQTDEETDVHRDEADQCAQFLTVVNGQIVLDEKTAKELPMKQLIELRLFRTKFNEHQLVLIMDGFDEIGYKHVVMQCFAWFAKFEGIRNIYLSSRPYEFKEDFRSSFKNCNVNRLKPFSRDDVILSHHKYLQKNVDDYKHCEKEQCMYVLTVLFIVITNILSDLTTVPLLLCLAQDTLLPVLMKHINFKLYTMSKRMLTNDKKLDSMQLVERFIDRKLHILNTDKSGTTDAAVKTPVAKKRIELSNKQIKNRHVLLAMCAIFDKNDRKKLLSPVEQESVTEMIEDVIKGEEKTGIIEGIRDGVPQFVHRIFAEYFAACWLSNNTKRFQTEPVFRSQVIWSHSLKKTRAFFDRMILKESEGCDLHWAVINKSLEQFRKIMRENRSAIAVKDKVGRLSLHLVDLCAVYDEVFSEDVIADLANETDSLFQWNALDYAFIQNNEWGIHFLMKCGVRLNVEILFQQLYSNDVDDLLFQGINYAYYLEKYAKQPDTANTIRTRLVKYLIYDRKLDIYSPRTKLKLLSVLEFCVGWNLFEEFHQFIAQSGQPEQVLDGLVDRLFQLAFKRKAHDIIVYLVDRCKFSLPWINDSQGLIACAKRAIQRNQAELFKMIFQQLCARLMFEAVDETDIIDESEVQIENDTIEIQVSFFDKCCVLSNKDVNHALPEYSLLDGNNVDEIFVKFLGRAIHVGSVRMASYILQKTKMVVTNQLIVTIMRSFPASPPFYHKKCMPAFEYLLNKTVDLHSVDQEGRNLFHMIAQNGCFYMLPCLIAKGFEPKQINDLNHWNGFHYLVSRADHFSSRVAKALVFLRHLGHMDGFKTLSKTGESVFDIAITNEHYIAAQMLFEAEYCNLSYSEKVDAVMDIMQQMLLKHDAEYILRFLFNSCWYTLTYELLKNEMWHAVYSSIVQQIPVV